TGKFTIRVTIQDVDGASASASSKATISLAAFTISSSPSSTRPRASSKAPTRIVDPVLAGDDDGEAADALALPAWLYGGDGNDLPEEGSGPNAPAGGAGDDTLMGRTGADSLNGNG